jgi:tRNA C32,U32 (ribose-2'-O)-methylase TrmJ
MLEAVASDVIENTVLLEVIYKNSSENYETDCAIACLIRSMQKTVDNLNEYIQELGNVSPPSRKRVRAILQMMFFTQLLRQENSKSLRMFIMRFTSQMKIMASPQCIWHQQFSTMQ